MAVVINIADRGIVHLATVRKKDDIRQYNVRKIPLYWHSKIVARFEFQLQKLFLI
jgi:hypothetical protein